MFLRAYVAVVIACALGWMVVKGKAFGALCIRAEEIVFLNLELSSKECEASAKGFIC